MATHRRYATYAWAVLAYNLVVIMWGAFVRATGSGAGCGSHWPLCNGQVIPRAPDTEMLIEFSHRISSGLALLSVIVLAVWAFRAFPKGHGVRFAASWSMFFMIVEALVGAGLVLLEYVASNASIARAYWMAGHLVNTFLLLAALALTAWWASGNTRAGLRGQGWFGWALIPAFVAVLILGASGGVTALGDTLVFTAGIQPEESAVVAALVDLRIYHPLLAFAVGAVLLITAIVILRQRPSQLVTRQIWLLGGLYIGQLLVGAVNVALKAPVPVQLIHLFLSNLIWIVLVLLGASALANQEVEAGGRTPLETASRPAAG